MERYNRYEDGYNLPVVFAGEFGNTGIFLLVENKLQQKGKKYNQPDPSDNVSQHAENILSGLYNLTYAEI